MSTPKTYKEYIEQLIKDGYLSPRNIAPLKCVQCDSKNLKDDNFSFEDMTLVEYTRLCKDCGIVAGYWSYGSWEI